VTGVFERSDGLEADVVVVARPSLTSVRAGAMTGSNRWDTLLQCH